MSKLKKLLQNKEEGTSINVSVVSIIQAYLQSRKIFRPFHARIERNDIVGFHPSGLYDACPRYLAFYFIWEKQLNEKKEVEKYLYKKNIVEFELAHVAHKTYPAKLQAIWDFGHLIHMWLQYSVFPDIGIEHKSEVAIDKLYDKWLIGGTSDILAVLQDALWYVIDIKTARSQDFYSYNDKWDIPIVYLKQLRLYMKGSGVDRACLLLICKNDSEMKEFFYTADEIEIHEELKSATKGKNFLLGKEDIPILDECTQRKGKYKKCDFSSVCFQCKKSKDLLEITTVKKHEDFIK